MPWVWLSVVPRTSWKGEAPAKGRPLIWVSISGQAWQPRARRNRNWVPAPVVSGAPAVSRSWPWAMTKPPGLVTVQIEEPSASAFGATPGPSGRSSEERNSPLLSRSR